jgi:hypothetical protein
VAAESSQELVILDRESLQEKKRLAVGRGPRQLVLLPDGVAVHCYQSFELYIFDFEGTLRQRVPLAKDPRPAPVALGEHVFTRPGIGFGQHHSCSSCHIETQNDGMIWNFGPKVWHNVRPIQLTAATTPLSWSSYAANAKSFGYMGPLSIMNRPPLQEEALGLGAFMDSLLGAPRATQSTQRDGSYSPEALVGKALFEGKAKCASCHTAPLYTNRRLLAQGKSGKEADVPSLLGAYRHGVYMIQGQARDLTRAVDVALDFVQVPLDQAEKGSLVRFLQELTPKGAYPLGIWPDIDTPSLVPVEAQPWVEFSEPVDETAYPGAREDQYQTFVHLETASGERVPVRYHAEGGRLRLIPKSPLLPGQSYLFTVKAGLRFRDGSVQEADRISRFVTAQRPALDLPASLYLIVDLPRSGSGTVFTQKETVLRLSFVRSTPEGQELSLDLGGGRRQTLFLLQDGESFALQSFALPVYFGDETEALADASAVLGRFDGNSSVIARGTLTVGAPGMKIFSVGWRLIPEFSVGP